MGTTYYPLSKQIADTISVHGAEWSHWHYCKNRRGPRLSVFEYRVLRIASVL